MRNSKTKLQTNITSQQVQIPGNSVTNQIESNLFQELAEKYAKDKAYCLNEDYTRSEVVKAFDEGLSTKLAQFHTPQSCASFRYRQVAKRILIETYAPLLSSQNDLGFFTVTPETGGIVTEDATVKRLSTDIRTMVSKLNNSLDDADHVDHSGTVYLGCAELSYENDGIQPHAHILCSVEVAKTIREAIKCNKWEYKIKRDVLWKTQSIPENTVRLLSYLLKGTTDVKFRGHDNDDRSEDNAIGDNHRKSRSKRPPKTAEQLMLRTLDQLQLNEILVARKDQQLTGCLESTRRITSTQKVQVSQRHRETAKGLVNRRKNPGENAKHDGTDTRIGSANWSSVYEFTRLDASKHVEKFPECIQRENINGKAFDAAFLCRTPNERYYVVRPADGDWGILRLDHKSADLEAQLNAAKIDLLSSTSINKLKSFLERLSCLDFPIRSSTSGLIRFDLKGSKPKFAFVFDNNKYCGHLAQAIWAPPEIETASPQKRTPLGEVEPWHVQIAPHVRGMPVATAIIAYALSVPFRQLDVFRSQQIDQATMVLAGASSRGKTSTALSLAQGLLAEPGAAENFNATVNALNERCALYQGRCMVVDDLSNVSQGTEADPDKAKKKRLQVLADFIRRMATGQDKARHGDSKATTSTVGSIVSANDLPGDFGQSDQEQVNMLKARSIQFNCGENDQLLNLVGLAPEVATETVKATADANYGWIGLRFYEALCEHLSSDLDGTTDQLLADFNQFRLAADAEFPEMSPVGKRVVKQFALMYATLRFANRTNVLPASIWGTPDRPIIEAMRMAFSNAGLDRDDTQSGPKSTANWPQARREKRIVTLAKRKPDLFIESTVRPFPIVSDRRAGKSVFVTKSQDGGYQIGIPNKQLLHKVFPNLGKNELRSMRKNKVLVTSDDSSLTATKPLRHNPDKPRVAGSPGAERCTLINISTDCAKNIFATPDDQAAA